MYELSVLDELVELVKEALDPYFSQSEPNKYTELFGGQATYFDPNSSGKISGDAILRHFAGYRGQIPPLSYEILNPGVNLCGDIAVFTFNLDTFDPTDGSMAVRWNTTQVHERVSNGWDIVHAHWSYREQPA